MSIFSNPNERNYATGRKNFTNVIKNNGSSEALVYLAGEEDFNSHSTLIVNPSEVAVFLKDGNIAGILPPGKHVLSTSNYPFLSRIKNMFSGGVSTYNCKIFFIKKAVSTEMLWGLYSPIQVRDPKMNVFTEVTARGSCQIHVDNPEVFLTKIVGFNRSFNENEVNDYFLNQISSYIRTQIAKVIMNSKVEILGIMSRQDEIAKLIKPLISKVFDDYGLGLDSFSIETLDILDNEFRNKVENSYANVTVTKQDIIAERIKRIGYIETESTAMQMLGNDYDRMRYFDALEKAAQNPGGGFANAVAMNSFPQSNNFAGSNSTGYNLSSRSEREAKLNELKDLYDKGVITKEQYDNAVADIISRM